MFLWLQGFNLNVTLINGEKWIEVALDSRQCWPLSHFFSGLSTSIYVINHYSLIYQGWYSTGTPWDGSYLVFKKIEIPQNNV